MPGAGRCFCEGCFFRLAELLPKLGDSIGIWRDWADDDAGLWVIVNTTAETADFSSSSSSMLLFPARIE